MSITFRTWFNEEEVSVTTTVLPFSTTLVEDVGNDIVSKVTWEMHVSLSSNMSRYCIETKRTSLNFVYSSRLMTSLTSVQENNLNTTRVSLTRFGCDDCAMYFSEEACQNAHHNYKPIRVEDPCGQQRINPNCDVFNDNIYHQEERPWIGRIRVFCNIHHIYFF